MGGRAHCGSFGCTSKKQWAMADAIRDELAEAGIIIKDTPQGTTWKKV